jgi:hypothetical protein
MSRHFLFLLGSARRDGNTEFLARRSAGHLPGGASLRWLRLSDLPLPPFVDVRHAGSGRYPSPTGHERTLFDATVEATDLVIASPLYWYSVSASTKLYLDHWAGWLRVPDLDFRATMAGRTLWGITAISHEEHRYADPLVGTLRLTAEYLSMSFGGVLLGYANRPGEITDDGAALARAAAFFTGDPAGRAAPAEALCGP